jgi:hypothetical protein
MMNTWKNSLNGALIFADDLKICKGCYIEQMRIQWVEVKMTAGNADPNMAFEVSETYIARLPF